MVARWRWNSWPAMVRWTLISKKIGLGSLHLVNLVCALHLFKEYVGGPSLMDGPSMMPTFAHKEEIIIESILPYKLFPGRLARGDLITLVKPTDPTRIICKRVIGLPGDVICVDPTGQKAPSTEHVIIPKGHVWIVGDNAPMSTDSRDYGPVPIALIRGRPFARIYPLKNFKIFSNPTQYID